MRSTGIGLRVRTLAAFLVLFAAPVLAAEPVVSVWYRGRPAGVLRLDDLAAIRALGFTSVTWPASASTGLVELSRMADVVGLGVVVQPAAVGFDPVGTVQPGGRLDLPVARLRPQEVPAVVWRAVAHGARVISFDPGQPEGTGLSRSAGAPPDWLAPAIAAALCECLAVRRVAAGAGARLPVAGSARSRGRDP